jgi:HSP20 family protein
MAVPSLFRRNSPFDMPPFGQLSRLFDELAQGFATPAVLRTGFVPALDVQETESGVTVTVDLPGLTEKDVTIDLEDETLTIRGEKKSETTREAGGFHVQERAFGSFSRSVVLPFAPKPEAVQATFQNGTLSVTLPRPPEARPAARRIQINAGNGQQG